MVYKLNDQSDVELHESAESAFKAAAEEQRRRTDEKKGREDKGQEDKNKLHQAQDEALHAHAQALDEVHLGDQSK